MINENELRKGDIVLFMITGSVAQFRGTVENPKGYHGRPVVNVTHRRQHFSDDWTPMQPTTLKGDDFILQEIVNPLVAESGIDIRKLESDPVVPPEDRKRISADEYGSSKSLPPAATSKSTQTDLDYNSWKVGPNGKFRAAAKTISALHHGVYKSPSDLSLLESFVELNRDVLVKYWDGEIEWTIDAIQAMLPINT